MLYVFAGVAVFLTIIAYYLNRATLGFMAGMFWALLAYELYALHITMWDIYYLAFWFTVFISFGVFLEAAFMDYGVRKSKESKEIEKVEKKEESHKETLQERRERLRARRFIG
jgi:hypothetical protein